MYNAIVRIEKCLVLMINVKVVNVASGSFKVVTIDPTLDERLDRKISAKDRRNTRAIYHQLCCFLEDLFCVKMFAFNSDDGVTIGNERTQCDSLFNLDADLCRISQLPLWQQTPVEDVTF